MQAKVFVVVFYSMNDLNTFPFHLVSDEDEEDQVSDLPPEFTQESPSAVTSSSALLEEISRQFTQVICFIYSRALAVIFI